MSLFGLMGGFDDDPIFAGHRSMMRQMDQMMNSMMRDPFQNDPFFGQSPFPALAGGHPHAHQHPAARNPRRQQQQQRALQPFPALGFPNVSNLMNSVNRMAEQGDCHTFSSSSVMTMTTGPDGRPTVYQASSSSRGLPGGVRETQRTVHDGRSGTKKMSIGHHIGERAHIIEREQVNGNLEEKQEFINLDEEEADTFNREFRTRVGGRDSNALSYRSRDHGSSHRARSSPLPALTSSSSYRRRSRPMLSIAAGPSEDRGRREREERRQRFK